MGGRILAVKSWKKSSKNLVGYNRTNRYENLEKSSEAILISITCTSPKYSYSMHASMIPEVTSVSKRGGQNQICCHATNIVCFSLRIKLHRKYNGPGDWGTDPAGSGSQALASPWCCPIPSVLPSLLSCF